MQIQISKLEVVVKWAVGGSILMLLFVDDVAIVLPDLQVAEPSDLHQENQKSS